MYAVKIKGKAYLITGFFKIEIISLRAGDSRSYKVAGVVNGYSPALTIGRFHNDPTTDLFNIDISVENMKF